MLTTAIIAFREFLEAFLIIGVFLGISRKLKLRREVEITIAAAAGIVLSFLLIIVTYAFSDKARLVLTEKNAELLESYLLIFSGFFIAYVIFSLHNALRRTRGASILKVHKKLEEKTFDTSLVLTIIFLVIREGFEIALFTASTSLFAAFMQNLLGLAIGFGASIVVGLLTFVAYIKLPLGKVFKATEYMIILLGASLVQNGVTELLEAHFDLHLSEILPLSLQFLPDSESVMGHLIKSFTGLEQHFSLTRGAIMAAYILAIYVLFLHKKTKKALA